MAVNYDDAFRTLLNDCPQLILPVINEVFHKHYDGTEKIVFEPNEHFLNQQAGEEAKVITDTSFAVISNTLPKGNAEYIQKYHWECESSPYDSTVLIRLYEYDSQIALDYNHRIEGDELIVEFPNTAVMLLRSTERTPDQMRIRIVVPGGDSISYSIPTMKIQNYSLQEIYRKKLLFLLPFYLLSYDHQLEGIEKDEKAVEGILEEYRGIQEKLNELNNQKELTLTGKHIIMDMINHVAQLRCAHLDRIREGVKQIMTGTLLYSEAYELNKEGREEGREEERDEQIVTGIRRAMEKQNLSLADAMEYMDIPKPQQYKYALHFCEPGEAMKYQC